MRHFKKKLQIIWLLLTDQYTNSDRKRTWYLGVGYHTPDKPRQAIKIMFGGED